MTSQDATHQSERLKKFRQLDELHTQTYAAMQKIRAGDPEGPHGQGPFTGNTRESRLVESLDIQFSPTRGGAPKTSLSLADLHIEAYEFARALLSMLEARLALLQAEMDKL